MATVSARRLLLTVGVGVALSFNPVRADGGPARSFEELAASLKEGDVLELTDVSGRQTRGRLAELSPCSIVVTTDADGRMTFRRDTVRKIRRLRQATRTAGMNGTGRSVDCDRIECTPVTLAVLGAAGVARGIHALVNPARTVYRAPKRQAEAGTCRPADVETQKSEPGAFSESRLFAQTSSDRSMSRTAW